MDNEMKRVLYEDGVPLNLNDFRAEQSYYNRHRGLINGELYTYGILEGLTVRIDESIVDEPALIVSPGTALAYSVHGEKDALREIILLEEDRLLLSGILEDAPEGSSDYYLSVSHLETEDEEARRTLELPFFNITVAAPADPGKRLTLARLLLEKSGEDIAMSLDSDQSIRPLIASRLNAGRILLNQEQNESLTLREELDSLRGGNISVEKELVADEYLAPLFLKRGVITQESWGRDEIRISQTTLLLEKETAADTVLVNIPETILELEGAPGVVLDGVAKNLIKVRHKNDSPLGYELYVEASPAMGKEAVLQYFTGKPGGAFDFLGGEDGYALTPTRTDGVVGKFQAMEGAVIAARDVVSLAGENIVKYGDIKEAKRIGSTLVELAHNDFDGRTLELKNGNFYFQYRNNTNYIRIFDPLGLPLTEEIGIHTNLSGSSVELYALDDGGFIYIFDSNGAKYTRYDSAGQIVADSVSLGATGFSGHKSIQTSNDNIAVVYREFNGSVHHTFLTILDTATSTLSTPYQMAESVSTPEIYAISTWGEGHFAVTYTDNTDPENAGEFIRKFSDTGVPVASSNLGINTARLEGHSSLLIDQRNGNVAYCFIEMDVENRFYLKLTVIGPEGELILNGMELDSGTYINIDPEGFPLEEGVGFLGSYQQLDEPLTEASFLNIKDKYFAMGLDNVYIRPPEVKLQNPEAFGYPFPGQVRSLGNGRFCLYYLGMNMEISEPDPQEFPEGLIISKRFSILDLNSNTLSSETLLGNGDVTTIGVSIEPFKDASGTFMLSYTEFDIQNNLPGNFYYDTYDSDGVLLNRMTIEDQEVEFESNLIHSLDNGGLFIAHQLKKDSNNHLEYFFMVEQAAKPFGVALQDALSGDELNVQIDGISKEYRNLKSGKKYYTIDGGLTRDVKGDYVGTALGPDTLLLKPGK